MTKEDIHHLIQFALTIVISGALGAALGNLRKIIRESPKTKT